MDTNQEQQVDVPNDRVIPSAIGDIHVPSSKNPIGMQVNFAPNIPIQYDGDETYGRSTSEKGIKPPTSFFKTAGAEFHEFNATSELIDAAYDKYKEPGIYDDTTPIDFKPNNYPEMFYDVKPQYQPYLLDSRSTKDLQYRRERVLSEQSHDDTLENGSMFARVIGGFVGAVADPINLIPIAASVKYAKLGKTFLSAAARALPGAATVGTIQAGAKELDRVNGNMHDFVVNSFYNTMFGTALFGTIGAGSLIADKMELWNLRKLSHPDIDFKMAVNDKDEIVGIKAFDKSDKMMNAAEVSKAQEMANSSFLKSGFFKIPYVGTALLKLKGAPIIGSPLIAMVNSPYITERAFVDRAADHSFYREGIEKGEASPKSFEHLMKQEYADLKSISMQLNTLHLQRNGFNIKTRPVQDAVQIGLNLKQKALDVFSKDTERKGYVSRDDFDDEIQRVLYTGEPSEDASVNEAATLLRKKIDTTWQRHGEAYGRSVYEGAPKMAKSFLMRVYDTSYLNSNKDKWVGVISQYLKDADDLIAHRMLPITETESKLKKAITDHEALIKQPSLTSEKVKKSSDYVEKLRRDLKVHNENLQNELRTNEAYQYHSDNIFDLSADEAKELEQILKPYNDIQKKIDEQQEVVSELKKQRSRSHQATMKGKSVETARKHNVDVQAFDKQIATEDDKLATLKNELSDEEFSLYEKAKKGEINPALYYPETFKLKNPNDRLKFRKPYESDRIRETRAAAYWDTIMHLNPEDTIADLMGKITGNKENTLQARSLLVPDDVLYDNNFMTKNIMAKVNNYVLFLSRRTHIKNIYKDVTHDGGIQPVIENLNLEYKSKREPFDESKKLLSEKIDKLDAVKDAEQITKLKTESKEIEKKINNETKLFNASKERMGLAYERMMGLRKREKWEVMTQGVIRSLVAMANLHLIPLTQVADLGAIGLQHGVWPFIRDGIQPVITSLNGFLKTEGSEAFREGVGHINLGLQDVLNGHADKNIAMETQPYVNMGRWVDAASKLSHFSSNLDLTTYIDNWLQRLTSSIVQSKFMKNLIDHAEGKISKKDSEYLLKYGIDPKIWSERMVKSYKDAKGFQGTTGGYQSMFWKWQDLEASNEFSSAVFRAVNNTIITRGLLDSPFWADNMMGMIFHTFTGWGYASVNRYLVPLLQRPDAEKMLGVMFALSMGALVSPLRRLHRGEDAYPDDMTAGQIFYEAAADSAVSSALANVLSYANFLSGDTLMGNLKNDKYRNRVGIGASSAVFGTANRFYNFMSALSQNEMNQKDANNMAHMLPFFGSSYGRKMSDALIDYIGLPANRAAAKAENG